MSYADFYQKKYEETGDEGYLELAKLWTRKEAGEDTRTKEVETIVVDEDDCDGCKI